MNIENEIRKEHSRKQAEKIAKYAMKSTQNFSELMICFFRKEKVISQRAAYSVSIAAEINKEIIWPFLRKMLLNLDNLNLHPAVKRNTVKVFEILGVPKKLEGLAFERMVNLMQNRNEPIAIRVLALTVVTNICKKHPDLGKEVRVWVEVEANFNTTPAFAVRSKRALRDLSKLEVQ